MRITVATKIVLGFLIVLGLGTIALLVIYQGLQLVEREMRRLAEIHEPANSATHEMEINVNGMAVGTLGYGEAPDRRFKDLVDRDKADFEQFHAKYLMLATTDRERELGEAVGVAYREFKSASEALVATRDEQAAAFVAVGDGVEQLDDLIDADLQAGLDPSRPYDQMKLEVLNSIEADLAEVGLWLANYRRSRRPADKAMVVHHEQECRATIARLTSLPLTHEQDRQSGQLRTMFERTMSQARLVLALEDLAAGHGERFVTIREKMDGLLDEEMQPLAARLLREPRERADAATAQVARRVRWLIPLFVFSAAAVAILLLRSITRPIKLLTRGTEAVSRGDLTHRIAPATRDEFNDLAEAFNHMVSRLHETLVSKERLQESERTLRQAVQALQQQIAERLRSEQERIRLQESLRRAETLSAMGALVAGVAHQVRNPLFGMSSVLDAMEARLGEREEYKQHFAVLREQAARLSTLMRELLEYGRPREAVRGYGSLAAAVSDATRNAEPLAAQSQVRVSQQADDDLPEVVMDRPRMVRVFEVLLENAIQHSPPGAAVTVRCLGRDVRGVAWVECRVEDAGPGFEPQDLAQVFQPFFSRRRGGTGLGLAIAQRIVENHGGHMSAENGIHGGAVVTLTLPVGVVVDAEISAERGADLLRRADDIGDAKGRAHSGQDAGPADR